MKHFLLFGLLFITTAAFSQRPSYSRKPSITGKVSGILQDSSTNEALPYAAIVIQDPKSGKDINGTITEGDGSFKFPAIPIGQYNLVISFVGYAPLSKPFTLTAKKPDFNFGTIGLVSTSKQLDEVVVKGERDLIENKIDKIVYNAEDDVANQGGDAADVLRRAPLLNVDLDGNVSLRGSSNVNILINGKPSSMFSANPGDALRSIPSDQIKSVEVITTPGAKYDGEGTAGIINIITKKSTPDGLAGSVDLSAGNRQTRGVLSLNGGTGRLGFNGSGSSFYSWPQRSTSDVFRENIRDGQSIIFTDKGNLDASFLGYFANAGMFYDFNAFNSISTSFRLRAFDRSNDGTYVTTLDDPTTDPATMLNYTRDEISDNKTSGYEWSLDYIKKFDGQDGREFSLSYKLDGNISDQNNEILQTDLSPENDPDLFRDEINFNDGDNSENTIQTDYVHPIGDKAKIEAGAKMVWRDVVSEFTYLERDMGEEDYEIDFNRTNTFFYDQNVYAGYLSTNFPISETMAVLAGVRYEKTTITGTLLENVGAFTNDYDNFLPNITISKNISQSDIIKLSYNKRIQRPGLRQINPYVNLNNTFNVSFGNPFLEPEITQQVELNYSAFVKKVTINTSIFYKRVTDVIESITTINEDNVSQTTFQNIGERNELGMNIFVSTKLFDIWTIRGGVNFSGFEATGIVQEEELTRQAFIINGNINSNIKLKKNWIIDVFGFYRAPQQTVQGFVPSFSLMVMGVRKTFWDEKASIGVRIVEPFFENKTFKSEVSGPDYIQTSEFVRPFRSVGISLRYRFGKLDYSNRQRRSKINNSDVKGGGDAQNSQF